MRATDGQVLSSMPVPYRPSMGSASKSGSVVSLYDRINNSKRFSLNAPSHSKGAVVEVQSCYRQIIGTLSYCANGLLRTYCRMIRCLMLSSVPNSTKPLMQARRAIVELSSTRTKARACQIRFHRSHEVCVRIGLLHSESEHCNDQQTGTHMSYAHSLVESLPAVISIV